MNKHDPPPDARDGLYTLLDGDEDVHSPAAKASEASNAEAEFGGQNPAGSPPVSAQKQGPSFAHTRVHTASHDSPRSPTNHAGVSDGETVGDCEGASVGLFEGARVGLFDGARVGLFDGTRVGLLEGAIVHRDWPIPLS